MNFDLLSNVSNIVSKHWDANIIAVAYSHLSQHHYSQYQLTCALSILVIVSKKSPVWLKQNENTKHFSIIWKDNVHCPTATKMLCTNWHCAPCTVHVACCTPHTTWKKTLDQYSKYHFWEAGYFCANIEILSFFLLSSVNVFSLEI